MSERLGTLRMVGGRPTLTFERRLRHPPEKVWRAVTDPTQMSHWFPATIRTDGELRPGTHLTFSFEGEDPDMNERYAHGEVIEIDPPQVYVFSWAGEVYRIEVLPEEGGSRLVFTTTLTGRGTDSDRASVARTAPGWDSCLDALVAGLDGAEFTPAPDWFLHRSEAYVAAFGLGEGTVHQVEDGWILRFERDLLQDHAAVWELLTGGEEAAPGAPPPLPSTHGYVTEGMVTAVESERILEYAWTDPNPDTDPGPGAATGTARFELGDQDPIGCRLVLTVTVPGQYRDLRALLLAAWQTHLEVFYAALNGEIRCPWPQERTETLRAKYADLLAGNP